MVFSILNMDFSDRVKSRMQALQISSVELAQQVGVSKGSVTHWTNGTNQAGGQRLIALARVLECDATWLATGAGEQPRSVGDEGAQADGKDAEGVVSGQAKESAATMVLDMLKKHAGKSLNSAAQQRIAQAVADSLADAPISAAFSAANDDLAVIRVRPGELSIPQYDVRGSMGAGEIPDDYVRHIRNVIISEEMVREMALTYTSPTNLCFMTGSGQSMEGTINDKSPLLVDRGVQSFVGDGIYAFTWNGLFQVKRLQMVDAEHVAIISDNTNYKPLRAGIDELYVHARVLVAWNARKL